MVLGFVGFISFLCLVGDFSYDLLIYSRGVNVRPNLRTQHEPDTGFFGLGLGLNGFGS